MPTAGLLLWIVLSLWDYAKEEALCVAFRNYEITSDTESTRPSIRFLRWHLFPILLLLHLFSSSHTPMYACASRPEKFCASFRDSVSNELPIRHVKPILRDVEIRPATG